MAHPPPASTWNRGCFHVWADGFHSFDFMYLIWGLQNCAGAEPVAVCDGVEPQASRLIWTLTASGPESCKNGACDRVVCTHPGALASEGMGSTKVGLRH